MLRAVLADFRRIPGVASFTILQEPDEEAAFRAAVRMADWSLVIAPEFHEILLRRCRWVTEEGGRLLGPSPDVVELCGDKLGLSRWLDLRGINVPETRSAPNSVSSGWSQPFVQKPRFGAGSQDTYLLKSRFGNAPWQSAFGEMIEQEFVPGLAVSVAFLGRDWVMNPCEQLLSSDGRLRYLGGRLPLPSALAKRALRTASAAVRKLPGMFLGYLGVDIVLGDDGRDWVIEINPRLTTSYIGLRTRRNQSRRSDVATRRGPRGAADCVAQRHRRIHGGWPNPFRLIVSQTVAPFSLRRNDNSCATVQQTFRSARRKLCAP